MSSTTPVPRMSLRTRDKDSQKHPGKPDLPRSKRPTHEVQAERAEKICVHLERERLRLETIQATAELETHMEARLREKLETAHRPPPSTQKKVLRDRAKALTEAAPRDNRTRSPEEEDVVMRGTSDSDEYNSDREENVDDESVDDEDDILDESSDGGSNRSRKKSKKSSRRQLRKAIQSAQGKSMPQDGMNAKRKAVQNQEFNTDRGYPQKKARKTKSGLHDDWIERTKVDVDEVEDNYWQTQTQGAKTKGYSRSGSSAVSVTGTGSSRSTTQPNSDDSDEGEGGISDDAGEIEEHENLSGKAMHPKTLKSYYYRGGSKAAETGIHSLARIVPTTSVPTFVQPTTSSHAAISHMRRKKGDIRLTDLPAHLQGHFTNRFTPRLYELFGTLSAWEQPPNTDIQRLWEIVFPRERSLDFGTSEGTIVHKLIEDRLSQWRKKFGEQGLEALEEVIFNNLPKNNTENRRLWCNQALSEDDTCQPFYYSIYEAPDSEVEGSQLKAKGIFQSPLVAAIFGTHVSWLSAVEEDHRSDKKPIGALVHSIQAAKRAISWWESGEMVKPKKPLNEYSKANWGDHVETREGRTVHIYTTSNLAAIVSQLKDKQWEKIFAAARASGKRKKKAPVVLSPSPERSRAALVELRDDDSDLDSDLVDG